MVDDDTFVCSGCTFEYPLGDLGAIEITKVGGHHHKIDFACARCAPLESPGVVIEVRKDTSEKQVDDEFARALANLKINETVHLVSSVN